VQTVGAAHASARHERLRCALSAWRQRFQEQLASRDRQQLCDAILNSFQQQQRWALCRITLAAQAPAACVSHHGSFSPKHAGQGSRDPASAPGVEITTSTQQGLAKLRQLMMEAEQVLARSTSAAAAVMHSAHPHSPVSAAAGLAT
jgi:hypothetical protein